MYPPCVRVRERAPYAAALRACAGACMGGGEALVYPAWWCRAGRRSTGHDSGAGYPAGTAVPPGEYHAEGRGSLGRTGDTGAAGCSTGGSGACAGGAE